MDCKIQIKDSVYSKGMKEIAAIAIEDFLLSNKDNFLSDGYEDTNSSNIRNFLEKEFPEFEWTKNHSQSPFDIYSIDALVAIELKSVDVSINKKGGYSSKKSLVLNATVYPDVALVKDVVTKEMAKNIDKEILNSFMDVILVIVNKNQNKIVGYKVVDGSFWGINYDIFCGCRDLFSQANNELEIFMNYLEKKYSDNAFLKAYNSGQLKGIDFKIRKLISCKNPIGK